jgi:hypothetical protein
MSGIRSVLRFALSTGFLLCLVGSAAHAQGKGPKHYAVSTDRAIVVTRDVLVRHGYEVVRVEDFGNRRVVWYRVGNRGKGRGKGKLEKLVIERQRDRIVFVDAPDVFLADIDIRLRL